MIYNIACSILALFYYTFFNITVIDEENLPRSGGAIVCANHLSYNDPMVLGVCLNRKLHFMGKKELFANPFFSFILTQICAFPVDRDNVGLSSLKQAINILKEGNVLGIFAQSTRNDEIEEKGAKSGVSLFAIKSGAPVVPVAIKSDFKMFGRIVIAVGKPIEFNEEKGKKLRTEQLNEITEKIMVQIKELYNNI